MKSRSWNYLPRVALGTFRGRFLEQHDVVIKGPRLHDEKYIRGALHEISIWRKLKHRNILTLLGSSVHDGTIHMVSPFMENGTALEYVRRNPSANTLQLLVEVAQGLEYMHTLDMPIIHGDLKGDNVLVSEAGVAYLSDFGLSRPLVYGHFAPASGDTEPSSQRATGWNVRYMAPEVILGDAPKSLASDIYSLGRVMEELFTAEIPFGRSTSDYDIIMRVTGGIHDRPTGSGTISRGLDDCIWMIMLHCWDIEPSARPHISDVRQRLCSSLHRRTQKCH
ncbi:hypothetical protein BOTBODRAFT_32053 [Botryobasidium botryosum FD-172 SS1]|uniref:Protein kinase domain-containing protein n=1 Tax=Botryobasidium botryosum (strain FD-172 SS1) TaxID=930990 RepID=A0A067MGZ0_BOTB1|nr:hypothetical protein BOTBODRAFT_32053 [Botryobasidium botryosum FD-172 SS1]